MELSKKGKDMCDDSKSDLSITNLTYLQRRKNR